MSTLSSAGVRGVPEGVAPREVAELGVASSPLSTPSGVRGGDDTWGLQSATSTQPAIIYPSCTVRYGTQQDRDEYGTVRYRVGTCRKEFR